MRTWVQPLVGELISCKSRGTTKKEKERQRPEDRHTDSENTEEGHGSRKTRTVRDSEIEKQRDHRISPIYGVLKKWYK